MRKFPEGNAVVYCGEAFNTTNGKTAHGLVRFTKRYQVVSVIDPKYAGQNAGEVLDRVHKNIPIVATLEEALALGKSQDKEITHFVVGLAPDGGALNDKALESVKQAIQLGLHVDSGLHSFLSDNAEVVAMAQKSGSQIRDIRKPPLRKDLHFFSGKIEQVTSLKIAVLGTDSAVGKRTTAWLLVHALEKRGYSTEMIGTGQTAWLQGVKYGVIFDSLVNDFVSGEIEHATWQAWNEMKPDVLVIEGQGSLMNPAYPGGFEILAAGRPDIVVLQHAPARKEYDGFPGYLLHPLPKQIQVMESLSGKPVVAITINHEDLSREEIPGMCDGMSKALGLPVMDALIDGADKLVDAVVPYINKKS